MTRSSLKYLLNICNQTLNLKSSEFAEIYGCHWDIFDKLSKTKIFIERCGVFSDWCAIRDIVTKIIFERLEGRVLLPYSFFSRFRSPCDGKKSRRSDNMDHKAPRSCLGALQFVTRTVISSLVPDQSRKGYHEKEVTRILGRSYTSG